MTDTADRESIRDAIARYCIAMDEGSLESALSVFSPDAAVDMYGHAGTGTTQIKSALGRAAKVVLSVPEVAPLRHFLSTQLIQLVSPDEATSTTYVTVVSKRGADHWGAYVDNWTKADGRWLIARRTVTLDGFIAGSAGERLHAAMSAATNEA